MKFIKLCMIIGLVASGTVYGESSTVCSSAEIESKNEETAAILQNIERLELKKKNLETKHANLNHTDDEIIQLLHETNTLLKETKSLLGLPHDEPGKDWTKIALVSAGVVTLTAVTGGLAGGALALLIKGTGCTAAQLGASAGGLVGAHGIGTSLYKKGDVDFDEVAKKAVPRAALTGGVVGGTYAIATGVMNGFDSGIGATIATYINKSNAKKSNPDIADNLSDTNNQ